MDLNFQPLKYRGAIDGPFLSLPEVSWTTWWRVYGQKMILMFNVLYLDLWPFKVKNIMGQ